MIDFRYHLVSIVAVFLALAIGIVIGSTSVLKGATLSVLEKTSSAEKKQIDSLINQNALLSSSAVRTSRSPRPARASCCTACSAAPASS